MKNTRSWLILLLISTATATFACRATDANQPPGATVEPQLEAAPSTVPEGQCAYALASYNLPELSEKLDSSVQALNPSATARAQVHGQDCIYSDGNSVFTPMQTDFSINLAVVDLANEEAMGNWIAQVMPIILQIPPEELEGSMPGNVAFTFIKTEAEQIHLSIPIYSYREFSEGRTGIELFRYYHIPPTSPT